MEKAKYSLSELTGNEFARIIFAGTGPNTLRGPSDAFTLQELLDISQMETFATWESHDRMWLYSGIDYLMEVARFKDNEIRQTPTGFVQAAAAALFLWLLPMGAVAQTVQIMKPTGQVALTVQTTKQTVNVRDAKGNVVATGTVSKGDVVVLRDKKGNVIATIKKGSK